VTSFLPVAIHESRFPGSRGISARAAFARGRLPGWLLYEGDSQAARWLAYHAAWSPARTEQALRDLYGRAFEAAWAALDSGPRRLVSLGCGGGRKDGDALDVLPGGAVAHCDYTPVDSSLALVLQAARHVAGRHALRGCSPLVADLEAEPALEAWLAGQEQAGVRRLFTCFGMIPNLDPDSFPRYVAGLLRPGDGLLLSANLSPGGYPADGGRILAQYDNPEARAWYQGALAGLGLTPDDVALTVQPRPLTPEGSRWLIEAVALARRPKRIEVEGATLELAAGSTLRVFHSLRFTLPAILDLLRDAGLVPAEHWLHAAGEEGIFRCEKRG